MKKFFKIVLFAILTLSLINISDTKINYLNNNNEVEKVKSPRKNAIQDISEIQDLNDLSYTEWYQKDKLGMTGDALVYLSSTSNTQVHVCDVINNDNIEEKFGIYTFKINNINQFGIRYFDANSKLFDFYSANEGSGGMLEKRIYKKNIIKFYDMSSFTNSINNQNDINTFLEVIKTTFTLNIPKKCFLQVNDTLTENREELDKNFNHIYINGLEGNYNLNEKIDISSIVTNQNITEIEISLVYNDLPTIIYNLFDVNYPFLSNGSKKYTLSGNIQKQWGNLTRTLKFTINNRELDESILKINFFTKQHTINALRGKSFVLNTNINLPKEIKGSTNYIDIRPAFAYTDTIQPGFYVSYAYNQDKILNEYMDVYSTNYYKYVMQINKAINTNGDLGILLYDNDNSPKASGTPLYNFTQNGFIATYGIPPRIITFTNQFNTNNLITLKLTSEGEGSSFIFDAYDWLLSNGQLYQIDDYETAYQIGYSEGMHFSTSSTNWIKSVFNAVDSVLQIEILPNFKLWYIVAIPLLFGCVLFVFKILR